MADETEDSGIGYGLDSIKNFLDTVTVAANQKAASAKKTAEVTQFEASQVADSQMEYADSADKALVRLKNIETQGDTARAMADSGNIFDRISLIGDQMLNPQAYTREGRMARTGEIATNLSLEGQIQNIKISASQARIDERKADEAVETADSSAGLAKLQAQVDGMTMATQAIQQTETLRGVNLSKVDLPTIDKALVGPVPPTGKVKINGFDYSPMELKERQKDLDTRSKLATLSPMITDPEYAGKMRIQQSLSLQTMSLPDLEALRSNNYIMDDGSQVFGDIWDHEYDRKRQMQSIILDKKYNQEIVMNQLPVILKDNQDMLKAGQKYYTPGTPLANARNKFEAELVGVAKSVTADPTPEAAVIQTKRIQDAQDRYVKEVQAESLRLAGNDKEVAAIYTNQRLGLPMSSDEVATFVTDRYKNGKDFGTGILPEGMGLKLKQYADKNYLSIKRQQAQDIMGMDGKLDDKTIREQAAQKGFEQLQYDSGVHGMNIIQSAMWARADNPAIKKGLVPGQLQEISARASQIALEQVAKDENLTPDQVDAIRAGRFEDTGMPVDKAQQIAETINTTAMFTEYDLLDQARPGLAYETQQWYGQVLPELSRQYTSGLDPTEAAMTGDHVLVEAQKYHQLMTFADESATQRGKQLAIDMATGAKRPENMWPVLLTMDKTIADSQKQSIFYDVIRPAMKAARAKGANDELTMQAAFDSLTTYQSEDKQVMGAINTFNRNMPHIIDNFGTMWDSTVYRTAAEAYMGADGKGDSPITIRTRVKRLRNDPDAQAQNLRKIIPWMRDDTAPSAQDPRGRSPMGIAPAQMKDVEAPQPPPKVSPRSRLPGQN